MFITSLQYRKITITILADCINALASVIKVLIIRITIMRKKTSIAMVGQFGLTGAAVGKKKVFTTRVVNHTPK